MGKPLTFEEYCNQEYNKLINQNSDDNHELGYVEERYTVYIIKYYFFKIVTLGLYNKK